MIMRFDGTTKIAEVAGGVVQRSTLASGLLPN